MGIDGGKRIIPRMLHRFIERFELGVHPHEEYTPATFDARKALKSWGFDQEAIRELQEIIHQFKSAYLNCVQKVEALHTVQVRGGIYDSEVILPIPSDESALKISGNCVDIAHFLAERILSSGVLDKSRRMGKGLIELRIVRGHNRTHFKKGCHVWLGLVEKGKAIDNMVVLDGSYQEISHLKNKWLLSIWQ